MANDSWDWPAAFERAGKHPFKDASASRLTTTLKPEDFARALRSMWVEHGMLERSDPRVQEFSRSGRLEWWDGRGRCVVLVREGSRWQAIEKSGVVAAPPLTISIPIPQPESQDITPETAKPTGSQWPGPVAPIGPDTGQATFAKALDALKPKGKKK